MKGNLENIFDWRIITSEGGFKTHLTYYRSIGRDFLNTDLWIYPKTDLLNGDIDLITWL